MKSLQILFNENMNNITKCVFDKPKGCYALACYSDQRCSSRDKNGNPIYVSLDTIKEEKK